MTTAKREIFWGNDKNVAIGRPLQLCRPCICGCDRRAGNQGVGYLTGDGFTIWIETEEVYQALANHVERAEH